MGFAAAKAVPGISPKTSTSASSRENILFIKSILSFLLLVCYMVILGKKTGAVNMKNAQNNPRKFVMGAI